MKEKVAVLIDKLQELKEKDATLSELSHYTKLLYAELMCAKSEEDKRNSTRKVSVILPGYEVNSLPQNAKNSISENQTSPSSIEKLPDQIMEEENEVVEVEEPEPLPAGEAERPQRTLWDQPGPAKKTVEKPEVKQKGRELNDLIAEHRPSLNDRLKTEREEIAGRLGNSPIKDLHQAIGLNEKFGFINELFRGDQSLYNRSIKTINDCKDLQEALYWINRELKIKLGWPEENKTVQRFYTLIRKRFS